MFMCQAADGLFCFLVGGALNNECVDFESYINASALTHHYLVMNILNAYLKYSLLFVTYLSQGLKTFLLMEIVLFLEYIHFLLSFHLKYEIPNITV